MAVPAAPTQRQANPNERQVVHLDEDDHVEKSTSLLSLQLRLKSRTPR